MILCLCVLQDLALERRSLLDTRAQALEQASNAQFG